MGGLSCHQKGSLKERGCRTVVKMCPDFASAVGGPPPFVGRRCKSGSGVAPNTRILALLILTRMHTN